MGLAGKKMNRKILVFLCWLAAGCLFSAPDGKAEMEPVKKIRAGFPPFEVIEDIMLGNRQSSSGPVALPAAAATAPHMTWLADCDARLQPALVHVDPLNKVYTVRNPGNQFALSAGAIDYGVRHLFTPVLLITGNTDNDAIRLFMQGYEKLDPALRQDLDHLRLPLGAATEGEEAGGSFADQWLRNIEKNIDFQVNEALTRYRDRLQNGRLVVVGAVIDLANQYGHGEKKLIIINVNGETDPAKMKEHRQLVRLDKTMLQYLGRKKVQPAEPEEPTVPGEKSVGRKK